MNRATRRCLAGAIALLLASLAGCRGKGDSASAPTPPAHPGVPTTAPAIQIPRPTGWADNWPAFRGPGGDGRAAPDAAPLLHIDLAKHVRYKTPVPPGNSSPIVWGERIYLTAEGERILAYDRATGRLVWDVRLRAPPAPAGGPGTGVEPDVRDTGFASPTACTDGRRVYAFFGSGVIGAVDLDGRQVWAQRLVDRPANTFGLAASPVRVGDWLIQVVDMGQENAGRSFVVALRAEDGLEEWRQSRPVQNSWATPIVAAVSGRVELITCATPWVIAYDAIGGAELWRAGELNGDVAASPVVDSGVVFALCGEGGDLLAIRGGGEDDVSRTHVLWSSEEEVPDVASPVAAVGRVIECGARGQVTCLNAGDGSVLWRKDLGGRFWASPVLAGDRLYAIDVAGRLSVLSTRDGGELANADFNERIVASPAFLGDRIYIRTGQHLLCIGEE